MKVKSCFIKLQMASNELESISQDETVWLSQKSIFIIYIFIEVFNKEYFMQVDLPLSPLFFNPTNYTHAIENRLNEKTPLMEKIYTVTSVLFLAMSTLNFVMGCSLLFEFSFSASVINFLKCGIYLLIGIGCYFPSTLFRWKPKYQLTEACRALDLKQWDNAEAILNMIQFPAHPFTKDNFQTLCWVLRIILKTNQILELKNLEAYVIKVKLGKDFQELLPNVDGIGLTLTTEDIHDFEQLKFFLKRLTSDENASLLDYIKKHPQKNNLPELVADFKKQIDIQSLFV